MDPYLHKYLKYKNKYIELNNKLKQIGAGNIISVQSIKNALENIELDSYKIFKINLTKKNKDTIESININNTDHITYNFYGNVDNFLKNNNEDCKGIIEYISSIGNNSKKTGSDTNKIIKNIIKTLSIGYDKKYCWITIRTSKPNNNFVIPRWHCDGNYFNPDKYHDLQTKFVIVLKGPGTLLFESDKNIRQIYNNYKKDSNNDIKPSYNTIDGRKLLDEELKDFNSKQIQLSNDEGIIFLSGHSNCTIHSEPNITEPRMFLSVVFADELSINEQKDKPIFKK